MFSREITREFFVRLNRGIELRNLYMLLFLVMAVSLPIRDSNSAYWDGNQLQKFCGSNNARFQLICNGYVVGVIDASGGKEAGVSGTTFCIANRVQAKQTVEVVKKWLDNNPAKRHLPGGRIVALALSQPFPC